MLNFQRILFPIDFSEQCNLAVPHVAALAQSFNAQIVLFHSRPIQVDEYYWEREPELDLTQKRLTEFASQQFHGHRVQSFVSEGDPAQQIVNYAMHIKADLIMMPTHGHGAFRRFALGSVTTKVLHDTHLPVWTSAHLAQRPSASLPFSNLLCAIDLDEIGKRTLRFAGEFAQQLSAALTIIHAVPATQILRESYLDGDLQRELWEATRARFAEMQASADTSAKVCIGVGNVASVVADAAQSHRAHLVVIGRGGDGIMGRLRTHDYAIIRESRCPVLSISQ